MRQLNNIKIINFENYHKAVKSFDNRIVHMSIKDSFSKRDYYRPSLRYEQIAKSGVGITVISLKKNSISFLGEEMIENIVESVDSIYKEGGLAYLQVEPEIENPESLVKLKRVIYKSKFDGILLNLRGKFMNTVFRAIIRGEYENAEKIMIEKIQSLRLNTVYHTRIIYKALVPVNMSGVKALIELKTFFERQLKFMPLALYISAGLKKKFDFDIKNRPFTEYVNQLKELKMIIKGPVLLGGGITDKKNMDQLLQENICDFIALGRPFVRQPDLLSYLRNKKIQGCLCVLCNGCINPYFAPVVCPNMNAGC